MKTLDRILELPAKFISSQFSLSLPSGTLVFKQVSWNAVKGHAPLGHQQKEFNSNSLFKLIKLKLSSIPNGNRVSYRLGSN